MRFVLNVDAEIPGDDNKHYVTIHDGTKSCYPGKDPGRSTRYWVLDGMPDVLSAWRRAEVAASLFDSRCMRLRECANCMGGNGPTP